MATVQLSKGGVVLANAPVTVTQAAPPLFDGRLDGVTPPWPAAPTWPAAANWQMPQSHNYGNPADTTHAIFGTFTPQQSNVGSGVSAGTVDLPAGDSTHWTRVNLITPPYTQPMDTDLYFTGMYFMPVGWASHIASTLGVTIMEASFPGTQSCVGLLAQDSNTSKGKQVVFNLSSGKYNSSGSPYTFQYNSNGCNPGGAMPAGTTHLPDLILVPNSMYREGVWLEVIVHIYYAKGTDVGGTGNGVVDGWFRYKGDTVWNHTVHLDRTTKDYYGNPIPYGLPTVQYTSTGALEAATVYDVQEVYRPPSTVAMPGFVLDGFTRNATFADAAARMP